MEVRAEEDKLVELYDCIEERSGNDYWREYLTFFPFLERVSGFSTSRVALNPEKYTEEMRLVREKKIELRQVLFCREKFDRIEAMLDVGCGHGTDVIETAKLYPQLQTDGYTITPSQARLGKKKIDGLQLGSRVRIFNKDSTKDPFPRS